VTAGFPTRFLGGVFGIDNGCSVYQFRGTENMLKICLPGEPSLGSLGNREGSKMTDSGRYATAGLDEACYQPVSNDTVLKNLLGHYLRGRDG